MLRLTEAQYDAHQAKLRAADQPKVIKAAVTSVEFMAPYPPSLNRMYRTVNGRMLISAEGRAFKEQVAALARASGIESPMLGWLEVVLTLHPVEPADAEKRAAKFGPNWHRNVRSQDVDNVAKGILDAMQGVAYQNDSQIVVLLIQRGLPVPDGGLSVQVRESDWREAA